MTTNSVGIIGAGLLGGAIAERLLGTGMTVITFDPSQQRQDELRRLGATVVDSSLEVAVQSQRIVLSLPDSKVAAEVVGQIRSVLSSGHIIIDTTTGDPNDSQTLAASLLRDGVDYLDATVAGSSEQARHGVVLLMVGGRRTAFHQCIDIFDALASRTFHLGPSGDGAKMKLVLNLVLGLNRAVLAEGLSLADAIGIPQQQALDILRESVAYSRVMDVKGPKMIAEEFSPQARLAQHLKDVELIRLLGSEANMPLPLSAVHQGLLERAVELGFGDVDNSAVIKAFGRDSL